MNFIKDQIELESRLNNQGVNLKELKSNVSSREESQSNKNKESLTKRYYDQLNESGADLTAIVAGSAIGFMVSGSVYGVINGGLFIGAGAFILNKILKENSYIAIADIEISEKIYGNYVHETEKGIFYQDDSTYRRTEFYKKTNRKKYRTKIVSSVSRSHMTSDEAKNIIQNNINSAILGIL
jgi:hypothetical protein